MFKTGFSFFKHALRGEDPLDKSQGRGGFRGGQGFPFAEFFNQGGGGGGGGGQRFTFHFN